MARLYQRTVSRKPAESPGTVAYQGAPKAAQVSMTVFDYKDDVLQERTVTDVRECLPYRDTDTVTWINIDGLHDTQALRVLNDHFGIHLLVQEDIVNTYQRPKVEDFGDYLFIVLHMLSSPGDGFHIQSEQLSLVLGRNFVISFQEIPGDVLEPVRERLRKGKGRIRTGGADYLAYALLDAVIDHYFLILEKFGDLIEDLEEDLLNHPSPEQLRQVHRIKREMILMRRTTWPLRELVGFLERAESPLIQERTKPFLRDVYDHTVQVAEAVETFRDMLTGLQDLYLSSLSNRMNEVMKVLTIAAVVFAPLTFIAGIYGMNFEFMPELKWRYGYPAVWGVMAAITVGMIIFFRRRKYF